MADLLASALDRDESEARMRHQSLHDALTGLPNRTLFYDRIEHAFARAQRAETLVAVLLLDVDQFKTINDSLGHEAGDDLLVALSARLQHVIRGSDTVARLGGDEFVVLCEVESEAEAFAVAERIADAWERPIPVGTGGEIFVSASIGITIARRPQSAETMLREADAAMYRAKEGGRGRYELFDEEMRQHAFSRLRTESDLRRAVEREQFRVHYQPIFDVAEHRLLGVEALVRWDRPGNGIVGPAEFIGLTEETGLIAPLGRWVLEQATAQVARVARALPARRRPRRHRQRLRPPARPPRVPRRGPGRARPLRPRARQPRARDHRERPDEGRLLAALDPRARCARSASASSSTTSAPATRRCRA